MGFLDHIWQVNHEKGLATLFSDVLEGFSMRVSDHRYTADLDKFDLAVVPFRYTA